MAQLQTSIPFDPKDPFPLLEIDSFTYEAAKLHSFKVDQWLGLPTQESRQNQDFKDSIGIEKPQTWSHLDPQQFQTPYCELRCVLHQLNPKPQERIIDLGCGYGRMGFILHRHYPECDFVGFEFDSTRVKIAQKAFERFKAPQSEPRVRIQEQDLTQTDFQLPEASLYFLFDYGETASIRKTLRDLQNLALRKSIKVVGRGRATRHLIQNENPWLSQVHDPEHTQHYSIYKS